MIITNRNRLRLQPADNEGYRLQNSLKVKLHYLSVVKISL